VQGLGDELRIGERILCVHGWQYDPYLSRTVGHGHEWSTTVHHMVERYLGTWLRIPLGEFYTRGNRLMFWLAHKLAIAAHWASRLMKALGSPWSADALDEYLDYWARGNMGDPMGMFRPTWLDLTHRKLDEAVFTAYGWSPDMSNEELLAALLELNLQRAAEEEK